MFWNCRIALQQSRFMIARFKDTLTLYDPIQMFWKNIVVYEKCGCLFHSGKNCTYRSWWVERDTASCSTSLCCSCCCWRRGGGDTEAFLFLPRPRPTFKYFKYMLGGIWHDYDSHKGGLTPTSGKLAFPLPTPNDTPSIGLKESYKLISCFPRCNNSYVSSFDDFERAFDLSIVPVRSEVG